MTLRQGLRRFADRLQCSPIPGIGFLGDDDQWAVHLPTLAASRNVGVALCGGAGLNVSFEVELARAYGFEVHLYDPTPTGVTTWEALVSKPASLHFHPLAVAARVGEIRLGAPEIPDEGSYRIPTGDDGTLFQATTLPVEAVALGRTCVDVVKLDIEGSEYEALDCFLDAGLQARQVCVEFHDFFSHIDRRDTVRMQRRLAAAGFTCVWKRRHDFLFVRDPVRTTS